MYFITNTINKLDVAYHRIEFEKNYEEYKGIKIVHFRKKGDPKRFRQHMISCINLINEISPIMVQRIRQYANYLIDIVPVIGVNYSILTKNRGYLQIDHSEYWTDGEYDFNRCYFSICLVHHALYAKLYNMGFSFNRCNRDRLNKIIFKHIIIYLNKLPNKYEQTKIDLLNHFIEYSEGEFKQNKKTSFIKEYFDMYKRYSNDMRES